MKIITTDAVYVQNNDMMCLMRSIGENLSIPASIIEKVFGGGIVIIDDRNRYDFIKFEKKEEIDFFKGLDWIIDYNEVKDLSKEEIINFGQEITDEKNRIADKFNSLSVEERNNNSELISRYELLDYKVYSLRDFLWFKEGYLKFKLPEGIDAPEMFVQKEKKGIRRLARTLFAKKNKRNVYE